MVFGSFMKILRLKSRKRGTAYFVRVPGFTARFLLESLLYFVSCATQMVSVSLYCPFVIAPSVFSHVY